MLSVVNGFKDTVVKSKKVRTMENSPTELERESGQSQRKSKSKTSQMKEINFFHSYVIRSNFPTAVQS